jgi:hypothetical protein
VLGRKMATARATIPSAAWRCHLSLNRYLGSSWHSEVRQAGSQSGLSNLPGDKFYRLLGLNEKGTTGSIRCGIMCLSVNSR